ncbi:MAG: TonB-dependent receptor [Arcobacter sp.]|nr:TonB-dependent receptor [Arcobacter sp.]|tara:strand:+ start:237 stop:2039 length:1803 start_codon:yes stop_codon:yes gene_type:complete
MNKKISTSLVASLLLSTNIYANDTVQLDEITVTSATKSTQSIKDVTSNIDVITKEELEERNFTTVSEALNTVAGINVISNGGIGQSDSLYIRGISATRILVLIDGIKYNEPASTSGAPLAQLLIDDIEQIEVVKGAQSGIWGADASGGVINIITSKAKSGFHGNAGVEFGSFNTKKYSTVLSNKTEKGFIKVNANRFKTDGFSAFEAKKSSSDYGQRGDDLGYERDGYTNNTYNIQAGLYLTANDEVNVSYKKIDAEYDYDSTSSDVLTNKTKIDHYFKSANYIHKNDNFEIKLNAQQSRFDRTQGSSNFLSIANEFSIESKIDYADNSFLTLGLNKQNFEHISNGIKYNTKAVFISNSNRLGKLIFAQTLRYDNNSKFDEKLTGKLGLRYNISKKLSISSNYGTAYNTPLLSNLAYTPTLTPETTKSFDLNVEYGGFKATYFKSKIKDMIDFSFSPSFHYFNSEGESKIDGYELSYKKDIIKDTLLTLNYTHLSAVNDDGKDLKRRAKRQLGFGIDYYGFDKLHLNANGSYIGTRYNSDDKGGASTGNYTLWNAVANYKINKTFSTYLKVDNLFNKYYQTIDGYATAERSAYVGLKATF